MVAGLGVWLIVAWPCVPVCVPQVIHTINQLEKKAAQKLCLTLLAASPRLDQLWSKCTPAAVKALLDKDEVRCRCPFACEFVQL